MEHNFYIIDNYHCPECDCVLEYENAKSFDEKVLRLRHPKTKCPRSLNLYYAPGVRLVRVEETA